MLGRHSPSDRSIVHVDFATWIIKDAELEHARALMKKSYHKNWLALFVSNAVQACIGKPLHGCAHSLDVFMKKVGTGASHFLWNIRKNDKHNDNSAGWVSWTEGVIDFLERLRGK